MKLEGTVYCEGPDCRINAHVGPDTMENDRLPVGWVRVQEFGSGNGDPRAAFCGWNCVLRAAAQIEPPTILDAADES